MASHMSFCRTTITGLPLNATVGSSSGAPASLKVTTPPGTADDARRDEGVGAECWRGTPKRQPARAAQDS